MHVLRIVPFCTVVLMSSGIARAQQVGERWVVKIEKAEVQLTQEKPSLHSPGHNFHGARMPGPASARLAVCRLI